jgi:hypothetical protein
MDNFTLAVVISDAVMILAMIALIVLDRKRPAMAPVKPAGKRPA